MLVGFRLMNPATPVQSRYYNNGLGFGDKKTILAGAAVGTARYFTNKIIQSLSKFSRAVLDHTVLLHTALFYVKPYPRRARVMAILRKEVLERQVHPIDTFRIANRSAGKRHIGLISSKRNHVACFSGASEMLP